MRIRLPAIFIGGGASTLFGSGLFAAFTHYNAAITIAGCAASTIIAIATAIVAIVKIRTNQSSENRRAAALARLARKHPNPDRAMQLLLLEQHLAASAGLTSEQAADLLKPEPVPAPEPDVEKLVQRADAGQDIVPDHPPGSAIKLTQGGLAWTPPGTSQRRAPDRGQLGGHAQAEVPCPVCDSVIHLEPTGG